MRNKTLTVALFEFTRTAMRKGFLVSAFVVPLLMILLMLVSMYLIQDETPGLGHNENIGFVDRSDLFGPRDGFAEFAGTGPAREALMRDELSLLFVIHEDYLATGNITIYSMNSSLLNGRSKGAIRSFIMKGLLKQGNVGEELLRV